VRSNLYHSKKKAGKKKVSSIVEDPGKKKKRRAFKIDTRERGYGKDRISSIPQRSMPKGRN